VDEGSGGQPTTSLGPAAGNAAGHHGVHAGKPTPPASQKAAHQKTSRP